MKNAKTILIIIGIVLFLLVLKTVFHKQDRSAQSRECEQKITSLLSAQGLHESSLISRKTTVRQDSKNRWLLIDKKYSLPYSVDLDSLKKILTDRERTAPFRIESIKSELSKTQTVLTLLYRSGKFDVLRLSLKSVPPKGKIAIVLDDWGYSYHLVPLALTLKIPLNISILPAHAYSERIARTMRKAGNFILLHLPMEPHNAASEPLEKDTILTSMDKTQVESILNRDFASVPFIGAVNNHMGSKATEDEKLLGVIFDYLKAKHIFFLDSYTSNKSVAEKVAAEKKLPYLKREVFLDDTADKSAIMKQLKRTEAIALKDGQAIAIGHDKKLTLETIKAFIPEARKDGIKFVYLPELIRDRRKNANHWN